MYEMKKDGEFQAIIFLFHKEEERLHLSLFQSLLSEIFYLQ